jgi:hypothetical protein
VLDREAEAMIVAFRRHTLIRSTPVFSRSSRACRI